MSLIETFFNADVLVSALPALLRQTVTLTGRIAPAADRHYRIAARFPGHRAERRGAGGAAG